MEIAVLYRSDTGFTRKYARLIADSLQCDIVDLKDASREALEKYPLVVYGGWVCGGKIQGLREALEIVRGRIIVFAVGALPAGAERTEKLKAENGAEKIPLFYFEGGMRTSRQTEGQKKALSMYRNALKQVDYDSLTGDEKFFLNNIGRSFDHSSKAYADELIERLKIIKNTRPDSSTWFEI